MCYSLEVSRNSFLINVISCFMLFNFSKNNNAKILSLFFLFIGFMQLFDWIFWNNQDTFNEKKMIVNKIFTKIAMIFNHLQPIVLALLLMYYKKSLKNMSVFFVML